MSSVNSCFKMSTISTKITLNPDFDGDLYCPALSEFNEDSEFEPVDVWITRPPYREDSVFKLQLTKCIKFRDGRGVFESQHPKGPIIVKYWSWGAGYHNMWQEFETEIFAHSLLHKMPYHGDLAEFGEISTSHQQGLRPGFIMILKKSPGIPFPEFLKTPEGYKSSFKILMAMKFAMRDMISRGVVCRNLLSRLENILCTTEGKISITGLSGVEFCNVIDVDEVFDVREFTNKVLAIVEGRSMFVEQPRERFVRVEVVCPVKGEVKRKMPR
ncbi:hypothetical protein TWF481_003172 [Arthrobotrys musiformis]|uniref:Uncharacterized protein n=1 Tax=Arthrobotrys musiformis TaxID=47236 RepID=A0AAV9VPL8_9PEZI